MLKKFKLGKKDYVVEITEDGCHILKDDRWARKNGYAALGGTPLHRLIFEDYIEDWLEKGVFVFHTCGNKNCMNPEHMKIGTKSECFNAYPRNWRATHLRKEEVKAIKKDTTSPLKELGRRFKVSVATISDIRNGKTWKNVEA